MNFPLPRIRLRTFAGRVGKPSRLTRLADFGTNPGSLNGLCYLPHEMPGTKLPLVVVLHGCTQTASFYDQGSGWSELASSYGFATLFPEQQRANNPTLCFNWFQPGDTRRGGGEALSIAQMIEAMIERYDIDPQRVYISGLSAGGAMTSVMLATYPNLFAGGAILAGLPFGAASGVPEALQQMRMHSSSGRTSGSAVRMASDHRGPWPTISVWHGTADTVVSPSNAEAIVRQWQDVHEVSLRPTEEKRVAGYPHRAWLDQSGQLAIEQYEVTGMGHGTPLKTGGENGCGQAGAFMLEAGISSTILSAATWGILDRRRSRASVLPVPEADKDVPAIDLLPPAAVGARTPDRITAIIEDALRKAGLLE